MHPLELLRHLARYEGAPGNRLAAEAAWGLIELADDPGQLVLACRRLTEHHPIAAPLWTLAARALTDLDPSLAIVEFERRLEDDQTPAHLAAELARRSEDGVETVTAVVADPFLLAAANRSGRCDIWCPGPRHEGGWRLAERAAGSDVVVIEALLAGPSLCVVPDGGADAAAGAREGGIDVILAVAEGCSVTQGVQGFVERRAAELMGVDLLPMERIDHIVRPLGSCEPREMTPDHPAVPELTEVK